MSSNTMSCERSTLKQKKSKIMIMAVEGGVNASDGVQINTIDTMKNDTPPYSPTMPIKIPDWRSQILTY